MGPTYCAVVKNGADELTSSILRQRGSEALSTATGLSTAMALQPDATTQLLLIAIPACM